VGFKINEDYQQCRQDKWPGMALIWQQMKPGLKDIIDLDYLAGIDNALESRADLKSRAAKDRRIYRRCEGGSASGYTNGCKDTADLLFSWLKFRRDEFFQDSADSRDRGLLPGSIFSMLYSWFVHAMVFFGVVSGFFLAYSFLAYHGTKPINVAVFITLFVIFQVVLILLTFIVLLRRILGKNKGKPSSGNSIFIKFLSSLFFRVLPGVLKKADRTIFRTSLDRLEYISSFVRVKNREYGSLFFWPFFVLSSIF
jgi:hypothetical protein